MLNHAKKPEPVLQFEDAAFGYDRRRLWGGLTMELRAGEFLAILGANGSGKTSLLRAVLGLHPLMSGIVRVVGAPPHQGSTEIGYVPQHRRIDTLTPLRARDVVGQGLDGHRWGIGRPDRARRRRIDEMLESVGARGFADRPIGLLSGGEQQRVRIAQALVADPKLLLCDEPLLSLDLNSQRTISGLVDRRRRTHDTAIVFVTHDINPVLPYVDRVLYLAGGRFRMGTVDEVMTSATLSDLYASPVEVVRSGGRVLVAGIPEGADPHHAPETAATLRAG
ncbi:ABC transporter ATP-binding protein [Kribbella capetownensis]|uniref:ABC transporter ATP-binding protein n=1 Tax=Kribbella capetownensis TaxID=1572659 RepID=A0A4R0INR1_9ACTN|nr:ABC transporter ATP-binding protein [Kribbella capetownensis]TCC35293.1 ABC transporter ATP-binding protein [Kribbella capetownensis]